MGENFIPDFDPIQTSTFIDTSTKTKRTHSKKELRIKKLYNFVDITRL